MSTDPHASVPSPTPAQDVEATTPRRPWVAPEVTDLARLTELTLQTPIGPPIPGGPSVFP